MALLGAAWAAGAMSVLPEALRQRLEDTLRHPVPLSGVLVVEEVSGEGWTLDRYRVRTREDGLVRTEVERSARLPRGLSIQELPDGGLEVRLPGLLGALPLRVAPTDPRALTRQGFRASDVSPVALAKAIAAQAGRLRRVVSAAVPDGLVGVRLSSSAGLPAGVEEAEAGIAQDGTVRWACLYRLGRPVYKFHLQPLPSQRAVEVGVSRS